MMGAVDSQVDVAKEAYLGQSGYQFASGLMVEVASVLQAISENYDGVSGKMCRGLLQVAGPVDESRIPVVNE